MSAVTKTESTFETARLDALGLLGRAQDVLVAAEEHGGVQRRGKQDALSLIYAAKAELRKSAAVEAGLPPGCVKRKETNRGRGRRVAERRER